MVEAYGANLLAGVHEESLALVSCTDTLSPRQTTFSLEEGQHCYRDRARYRPRTSTFLADLQAKVARQPKIVTGLPPLDELIFRNRYPSQTSPQLPQLDDSGLLTSEPFEPEDDSQECSHVERPKPVTINISSQDDGSVAASWYLAYHMIALATIFSNLGGRESCVVVIDCTGRFSASNLDRQIQAILAKSNKSRPPEFDQETAETALSHVHVLKCSSFDNLIANLRALPDQLRSETFPSFGRALSMVVVLGINIFQWQTRAQAEIASLDNEAAPSVSNNLIFDELQTIQDKFSCTVLYSSLTSSITSRNPVSRQGPAETPIIDVFSQNALVNLHPCRSSVAQFASDMSIEACILDRSNRQHAVRAANQLYRISSTPGGQSVTRSFNQSRSNSKFEMRVRTDGGVDFDVLEW